MLEEGMKMWETHLRVANMPRNTPKGIEEAVRRHEDETVIRDLIVRYTYYHDMNLYDETASLHHKDCVLHVPSGTVTGIDAIRAYWKKGAERKEARDWKHYATNTLVGFVGPDEAIVTSYFFWTHTLIRPDGSRAAAVGGGWYTDFVGRFGDRWLFKDRTVVRGYDFILPGVAGFGSLQIGPASMHGLPNQ